MSETRNAMLRTVARRVGQLVTIAAIGFLAWELHRQWGDISNWRPGPADIALLTAFAIAYGLAMMLMAYNWVTILHAVVSDTVPTKDGLLSYTKTQIAKYVPSNVLHFVGRHIYLKELGLPHGRLALASVLEIVSLPAAAVIAICVAIPFGGGAVFGIWDLNQPLLLLVLVAFALAATAIIAAWAGQRRLIFPASIVLCRATALMLFQGLIFALILYMTSGTFLALAIPVAIFAWLVGFVTPGAPAGVAVREAVIVNLLGAASLGEDVLIAALLFRAVTTVGDLVLYVFGNVVIARRGNTLP